MIFCVTVLREAISRGVNRDARCRHVGRRVALVSFSMVMYQPRVLRRFGALRDFPVETRLAEEIRARVPQDKNALFFNSSTLLYWMSHRYPNLPSVQFDIWGTYYLEEHPKSLLAALEDPNLVLVEFSPDSEGIINRQLERGENRKILQEFDESLQRDFTPVEAGVKGYAFWVRARSGEQRAESGEQRAGSGEQGDPPPAPRSRSLLRALRSPPSAPASSHLSLDTSHLACAA